MDQRTLQYPIDEANGLLVAEYEREWDGTTAVQLSASPVLPENIDAKPERYRDRVAKELDQVLAVDDPGKPREKDRCDQNLTVGDRSL